MLTTMSVLPDLEGRRYGTLSLGYDRIGTIRDEFSALLALAAEACACDPADLTILKIQQVTGELRAKNATVDGSTM
jgi:hypothetical protein